MLVSGKRVVLSREATIEVVIEDYKVRAVAYQGSVLVGAPGVVDVYREIRPDRRTK